MRYFLPLCILVLIFVRYFTSLPKYPEGVTIRVTGMVQSQTIRGATYQKVKVSGLDIFLPVYPEVDYGDRIVVQGIIENKKLSKVELLTVEKSRSPLISLKGKIADFFLTSIPEPDSSLVAGIVLGLKGDLSSEFKEKLRKTGTSHVVVASGMNISIFSQYLLGLLLRLVNRKRAAVITIITVWIYILAMGFDAPLVRAGIMGSMALLGVLMGRVVNQLRLLFITGSVMLLINPLWLTDLGFMLSFVATLSIIIFQERLDKSLSRIPKLVREGLVTSLSAQIGVTPILYLVFGYISIWSPITNALILWCVPPIMLIGGVSAIIGLFIPMLGRLLLYLVIPLTWWFIRIVEAFAAL